MKTQRMIEFSELRKAAELADECNQVMNEVDPRDILSILALLDERTKALERLLLEFDFLIEDGALPDIRNDIIFDNARKALEARKP